MHLCSVTVYLRTVTAGDCVGVLMFEVRSRANCAGPSLWRTQSEGMVHGTGAYIRHKTFCRVVYKWANAPCPFSQSLQNTNTRIHCGLYFYFLLIVSCRYYRRCAPKVRNIIRLPSTYAASPPTGPRPPASRPAPLRRSCNRGRKYRSYSRTRQTESPPRAAASPCI